MRLIKRTIKKAIVIAKNQQNYLGFNLETHEVEVYFTEKTGKKNLIYQISMDPYEALEIAKIAIAKYEKAKK